MRRRRRVNFRDDDEEFHEVFGFAFGVAFFPLFDI